MEPIKVEWLGRQGNVDPLIWDELSGEGKNLKVYATHEEKIDVRKSNLAFKGQWHAFVYLNMIRIRV